MTTTLKLSYESGNGVIAVTGPNGVVTLAKQGDETSISIHQGSDQTVTIQETGFVEGNDAGMGIADDATAATSNGEQIEEGDDQ